MADIFFSFTSSDRRWAFWIGQELEKLGHVPHIHEWEISAGGDIPKWMEESLEKADHCLLVVGKTYLTKPYSSWERRAAQWAAASTRPNFALPVFIEACEPILLAHLKRCALHGLSEEEARTALTEFLKPAQRPAEPQPFPGGAAVAFPGNAYAVARPDRPTPDGDPLPVPRPRPRDPKARRRRFLLRLSLTVSFSIVGAVILAGAYVIIAAPPHKLEITTQPGDHRINADFDQRREAFCHPYEGDYKIANNGPGSLEVYEYGGTRGGTLGPGETRTMSLNSGQTCVRALAYGTTLYWTEIRRTGRVDEKACDSEWLRCPK